LAGGVRLVNESLTAVAQLTLELFVEERATSMHSSYMRDTPLVAIRDLRQFEQVVCGAFTYRRKTLANSLALALDLPS